MTDSKLQNISSELFNQFVIENPNVSGSYFSAQTNRILAFESYIEELSDEYFFTKYAISAKETEELRRFINLGIRKYFSDNIKTLAIL